MIFTCEILVSKVEFWGALVKDSHALYLSLSQKIWSLSLWDRAYAWYKLHYSRAILFFLCFWAVFRFLKKTVFEKLSRRVALKWPLFWFETIKFESHSIIIIQPHIFPSIRSFIHSLRFPNHRYRSIHPY